MNERRENLGAVLSRSIRFSHLEISPFKVTVLAKYDSEEYELDFSFNERIQVTSDSIALALSTLCGNQFTSVHFDFEVSARLVDGIEAFTKAGVTSLLKAEDKMEGKKRSGNVLSFSGGFDSMAALALMPDDTNLVSLDFGGWFEREAEFFTRFSPLVVSTNVRRMPSQQSSLVRNHWGFMGIGAILTSDHFNSKYHTFGSILGRSFLSEKLRPPYLLPLGLAGLQDAPYSNGLTELGTAKIMLQAFPDVVADSLTSLAGKNDKKRFLKIVVTHLMEDLVQSGADLPEIPENWKNKIAFDESPAETMGALYSMWREKTGLIKPLFEQIPADAEELTANIDLSFMEKFNFDHSQTLADELWPDFAVKLLRYGFTPYTEADWHAAAATRTYLRSIFE